jgi:hypothetical protein
MSTPSTLNVLGDGGAEPPADPKFFGNVIDVSVSVSPPAAADTSCSLATAATSADLIGEYCATRLVMVWPAAFSHFPFWQILAPLGLP